MQTTTMVVAIRNHVLRDENNEPICIQLQVKTQELTIDSNGNSSLGAVSGWIDVNED